MRDYLNDPRFADAIIVLKNAIEIADKGSVERIDKLVKEEIIKITSKN